jgi:kinesin family protein 3/17
MPTETVRVVVRSRPLSQSEKDRGNFNIIDFEKENNQISIKDPKSDTYKSFAFDSVYNSDSSQQEVYDESAFPLVESSIQGYNSTIFAYGQTGCGKTFTMLGVPSDLTLRGIIPNSFAHIFGVISESKNKLFLVKCSYVEIYNEQIRDLLNYDQKKKLELKESSDKGIFIKDVMMLDVKNTQDISLAMESGNSHRVVKHTAMNDTSSRSHAIFIIYVESSEENLGRNSIRAGKLNLVDLAGSERQKKTKAEGDTLKEAIKINLSLNSLGNVITALVEKRNHVPYRDSKLTLLLQDSLGGNTKTLMIAVVSPADYNFDETLSTLRYASRAKFIQNKPKVNEDPKDAMLRDYLNEIQRLKALLSDTGPQVIERIVEKVVTIEKPEDSIENSTKIIQRLPTFKKTDTMSISEDTFNENEVKINEKEKLEDLIREIQQKLVVGGEELDKVEKERLKAQKIFRRKLKKRKDREKELLNENKKKEEDLLNLDKKYKNGQEELSDLRDVVKDLRVKYKSTLMEIDKANHDFEYQKEEFYEDLRLLTKENQFLEGVVEMIFPASQLEVIKKRAEYEEINHKWIIPEFSIENKQSSFPIIQDVHKYNSPAVRYDGSKKKLKPDDYSSDHHEFKYDQILETKAGKNSRAFREHFESGVKSEMKINHSELPAVFNMNKKMIADGFSDKKRKERYY